MLSDEEVAQWAGVMMYRGQYDVDCLQLHRLTALLQHNSQHLSQQVPIAEL